MFTGIFGQILKAGALGFIRHVATASGGALVAHGLMTSSQDQQAIGAIMTLVPIGFSVYDKWQAQQAKAAAVAAATAPPAAPAQPPA